MDRIVLGTKEFTDRVTAFWLGKNIGGTLGAPYEGQRGPHRLRFYDPVPRESAPNDDLDLQLVWLKLLEDKGLDPNLSDMADYWSRHAASYPWNEYGFFMRNYTRGLRPPVAGCFENYFVDEMGSPIRSEIWACLHPADPQTAAALAWRDSALDHAGGEGMYGEMFWAAVESAAFVERDPAELIRIGLSMIPLSSHVARAVREAVWCTQNGLSWAEARERIATRFGHHQPCNAVPNHGFTIIGWLYGKDFGDSLCKAVNCGFDTDCTGATLGSLLGILGGTRGIPTRWRAPVGETIVVHQFTRNFTPPSTITELAQRTVKLAIAAAKGSSERSFGERTALPPDLRSRLCRNHKAFEVLSQDIHMGVERIDGHQVEFHYGGEPVLRPGVARAVRVTLDGARAPTASLSVPKGWKTRKVGGGEFDLFCDGAVAARNRVHVHIPGVGRAEFTVLGPAEAQGFPAGDNVEKCPSCWARIEACICSPELIKARTAAKALTSWHVAGPFDSARPGRVCLEDPTPVDALVQSSRGGAINTQSRSGGVRWKAVRTDRTGLVDLGHHLGLRDYANGFAYSRIQSRTQRAALLALASDDGVRVWLNGEEIFTKDIGRSCGDYTDIIPIRLMSGTNNLLIKVDNYTGEWKLKAGIMAGN